MYKAERSRVIILRVYQHKQQSSHPQRPMNEYKQINIVAFNFIYKKKMLLPFKEETNLSLSLIACSSKSRLPQPSIDYHSNKIALLSNACSGPPLCPNTEH